MNEFLGSTFFRCSEAICWKSEPACRRWGDAASGVGTKPLLSRAVSHLGNRLATMARGRVGPRGTGRTSSLAAAPGVGERMNVGRELL